MLFLFLYSFRCHTRLNDWRNIEFSNLLNCVLYPDAIKSVENNIIFIVLHLHELSSQQLLQLRLLALSYLDAELFFFDRQLLLAECSDICLRFLMSVQFFLLSEFKQLLVVLLLGWKRDIHVFKQILDVIMFTNSFLEHWFCVIGPEPFCYVKTDALFLCV